MNNHNSDWVSGKGAWSIHIVLILLAKIFFNTLPGVSQELGWTLTNLSYMAGSFLMFHWVRGVPFDFNSGAYDQLNMWEQMDNGAQYTPAKKFLTAVPIVLFLLSTHYTHYDIKFFGVNLLALFLVLIPKLPMVCIFFVMSFNINNDRHIVQGYLESTNLTSMSSNPIIKYRLEFLSHLARSHGPTEGVS